MRKWLPYEINFLKKRGLWLEDVSIYGEKPIEYIAGEAEFDGNIFKVNQNVLIPRIETEELIEMAYRAIESLESPGIAEVATGSGCIGISLARRLEEFKKSYSMMLSDISEKALKIADENRKLLIKDISKINILHSDLFESFPKEEKFDLILANLPYVPHENIPSLESCVKDYEPLIALDGGKKGLEILNRFLDQAYRYLKPSGVMYLEVDETHRLEDFHGQSTYKMELIKDQFEKTRFLLLRHR